LPKPRPQKPPVCQYGFPIRPAAPTRGRLMASAPADAASTAALVLPAPPTASTASTAALVYLPTVFVNERIRFLFCKRTVVLQATFRSSCMRKYGVILSLFWSFPFAGWGQIRTEGVVRLEADQARIEAALDAALRTKQVSAHAEAWALTGLRPGRATAARRGFDRGRQRVRPGVFP